MNQWAEWLAAQAAEREEAGLRRVLAPRSATDRVLDLAGNDYLGLSRDPVVTAAAADAALLWGAGSGASRLVTGTLALHERLEHALADFTAQPAALVMSTGYHANLAVVTALADRDTLVVSDAHIHASLVDAVRLSRARLEVVPHSDVAAVRAALAAHDGRALVLAESIYSVLGDEAPLAELAEACAEHDALLVVDEAHALGVRGPGLVRSLGLAGAPHVLVTATLSKALGAQGGAVLCSSAVREHLVNRARPFIFDTALAPAAAAAALAALDVLRARPELPDVVRRRAARPRRRPRGRAGSRGGAVGADAVATGGARGPGLGARAGHPGRLLPPTLRAGRGLAAADHRQCRHLRRGLDASDRGARGGGQGTRMTLLVVTGTSTGVGKTVATAALAVRAGERVTVVKPVQTGVGDGSRGDAEVVQALTGCAVQEWTRLDEPLAPDTAARRAGVAIPAVAEHAERVRALTDDRETVIVEGAGGLLVRLDTDGGTLLDLASELAGSVDVQVVVVVAAGLGTLNHTELTVGALRSRGLEPSGLVVGSWPAEPGLAERCNLEDLPRITGVPLLAVIPEGAGS